MSHISKKASNILLEALGALASDIHLHPLEDSVRIHFRINGERILQKTISTSTYKQLLLHFKFTSGMDIGEKNLPQNGTMSIINHLNRYFLRLSTLPSKPLESLAIRILPMQTNSHEENLFLFPEQFNTMLSLLRSKNGLILFSGPTGSGKTTTMYSLLESIQKEKSHQAITLENPVEKLIPNILQIEINPNAGLTYEKGLQAVLRHDPDIILIGEILNKRVANFAIEAALTGHLVLSTLHAKNAKGTIERLLAMDFNKNDLTQALIGIVALQLMPIQMQGNYHRRAAIAEILHQKQLVNYLKKEDLPRTSFLTFHHLRKKAYAYGFLSKKNFY